MNHQVVCTHSKHFLSETDGLHTANETQHQIHHGRRVQVFQHLPYEILLVL